MDAEDNVLFINRLQHTAIRLVKKKRRRRPPILYKVSRSHEYIDDVDINTNPDVIPDEDEGPPQALAICLEASIRLAVLKIKAEYEEEVRLRQEYEKHKYDEDYELGSC